LSYGHSSGKVENKEQFINEAINGPVDFISIDISNQTIVVVDKNAIVRHIFYTKMKRDGKDDEIKISVLQVWQKQKGKWKLLARQAVKVP
ncbi:MAG: nuclear transport factor 2 family protein, partial [Chitinophagaceae bacterium]|nr:nuclear transport factor 2 family protein [Chitinophagaceae bacterium]